MDMFRFVMLLVAMSVLSLPSLAVAETVARALVTQDQGSVDLYGVDENGAWTKIRSIVDTYSTICRSPSHAIYKNGIVYVSNPENRDGQIRGIYKFDLTGTYLGVIETADYAVAGLAISPSGESLFAAANADGGQIVKIDTATETVSLFYDFGSGNNELRDMEIDNAGHLYVADRKGKLHIFNYKAEENADVPVSVDFNFCEGVGWNPVENLVYVAGNGKQWGVFLPDGTVHTPLTEAETDAGWCTGVACVGGEMYYESYSSKKLYRFDAEKKDFVEVSGVVHNSSFKGSDVCAVVVDSFDKTLWRLDDANGSARSLDDAGTMTLEFEGGVRMAGGGANGNCAVFASGQSRMTVKASEEFVPTTGDFAVFFRVGIPAVVDAGTPRHLFSNAVGADGDFAIVADAGGVANRLGFIFTPVGSVSTVEINTTAVVADGGWHHVGVVRHGAVVELWMDGERIGKTEVSADAAISANRTWSFGSSGNGLYGFAGAGAFFDEIMFSAEPPTVKGDIALVGSDLSNPGMAPSLPERLSAYNPMPESLGVEISHVFANEAKISMPSIVIAGNGDYYVSCDSGNGVCDPGRKTTVYHSADRGVSWSAFGEVPGYSVSLFEQDGVLCAVGLKAGLGYPASSRTFAVWTNGTDGAFAEAANMVAPMDCKLLPSPAVVAAVPDGRMCLVLATAADNNGVLSPAWVRFGVSGREFSNGEFSVNTRGFVHANVANASWHTTFSDALGGVVVPRGVNFMTMYPVIDRKAPYPEVVVGPERIVYQSVLGSGGWSRLRYNQFRGGAKPFNVRKDMQSSLYYAVTAPSTNQAELVYADADEIVGTLALYASPNPEYMAWYPCGVLDSSDEFGFAAPAFAFDGDDLVVVCAVSAPDGCGIRSRTVANYLSFRRFPAFRSTHPVQMPNKDNRTRAYVAAEKTIMKYYRTEDGEWQPDGVLIDDTSSLSYAAPGCLKVRGKKVFVLNCGYDKFCAFDQNGSVVASYTGPTDANITGMDISADGTRALLACGDKGVWECMLADNSLRQLAVIGGDLVNARDVAILPDGGFIVTNYGWGDLYTLRYDAQGKPLRLPMKNMYFTGTVFDPVGNMCYVGKTYGSVWSVDLETNTYSLIRNDIAGTPFNGTYFLSIADGKLWMLSEKGFITAYDPKTGEMSAPMVHHDYPLRGIAIYECVKHGFVIRMR